jgi:small-conductance mechanosensitive channel
VLIKRLAQEGIELEVEFWVADPEKGRAELVSGVNHLLLGLIRSHQVTIPQASEKESSVPT